jgi:hypothetical protein
MNTTETSEPIHTATSTFYGIEACVHVHVRGYSVVLRDTDADEFLPTVRIFPTLGPAVDYADLAVRFAREAGMVKRKGVTW